MVRAALYSPYCSDYALRIPPIKILIGASEHGSEDVVVKVSDLGGGIERSHLNHIFTYLFTTGRWL